MTKSIEEQAKEYYESLPDSETSEFTGETIFRVYHVNEAFLVGAKTRDEQWSAVVNELREFKFKSMHFPTLATNDEAADMANRVLNELLAKVDQMLKEMKINKGE